MAATPSDAPTIGATGSPGIDHSASGGRPVVLATSGVPFDDRAVEVAIDASLDSGGRLVVANVVPLEPLACAQALGCNHVEAPEVSAALRRPVELARGLGVPVERLRIKSFRLSEAIVELARDLDAGLLVFGPDRSALAPRRYRRLVRAVRDDVACLIWVAG